MRRAVFLLVLAGCPAPKAKEAQAPAPKKVLKTADPEPLAFPKRVRTSTDTAIDRGSEKDPGWTVPKALVCQGGATMKSKETDGLLVGWCVVGDQREGPLLAHRPSKKVAISGWYERGGRAGVWRFFDEDGEAIQRDVYRTPYLHRMSWSKGTLRFEGKTTYTASGVLLASQLPSLPVTFFHENGLKRAEVHFLVDRRHGPAKFFYARGGPEAIGAFLNNEPVGRWRSFDYKRRTIAPQPVREHLRPKIPGQALYDPVLSIEAPALLKR